MVIQDNYRKIENAYLMLKHFFTDREERIIDTIEKIIGKRLLDKETYQRILDQKRPLIKYNLLLPQIVYLSGQFIQNRLSMRAVPYKDTTSIAANNMTGLMFWNFNKGLYEFEEVKHFINTALGGISFTHDYWDFTKGHWVAEALDPTRIRWDLMTRKGLSFDDCRFMQDSTWITAEDILNIADGMDEETYAEVAYRLEFLEPNNPRLKNIWYEKMDSPGFGWNPDKSNLDFIDNKLGRYRGIDHHERRDEPVEALIDLLDPDKYEIVTGKPREYISKLRSENENFEYTRFNNTKMYNSIIVPALQMVIHEAPYEKQDDTFAFTQSLAYDFHPQVEEVVGVLDNSLDMNDSFIKRKSTILELLMNSVGGSWLIDDATYDKYKADYDTPKHRWVRRYVKGQNVPQRDRPQNPPEGLFRYANDDIELNEYTLGIPKTARGYREGSGDTGRLLIQRNQRADVHLGHLFNNLAIGQRMRARSCVKHIQQNMTEDQINYLFKERKDDYNFSNIEEMQSDGSSITALTAGEFDIEVDATKPSISQRESNFLEGLEYARVGMPEQYMRWDLVIKNSNFPGAQDWIKYIKQIMKGAYGIDVDNIGEATPEQMSNFVNSSGVDRNAGGAAASVSASDSNLKSAVMGQP